jgi:hypothetical protein
VTAVLVPPAPPPPPLPPPPLEGAVVFTDMAVMFRDRKIELIEGVTGGLCMVW